MVLSTAPRARVAGLRRLARSAAARRDEGVFLVEGATLVAEAASAGLRVREVYVEADRSDAQTRLLGDELARAGADLLDVGDGTLARVGASVTPQPLLAVVERPAPAEAPRAGAVTGSGEAARPAAADGCGPAEAPEAASPAPVPAGGVPEPPPPFVLVAVSIADPGNAGTLLRCAEAAGAGAVVFAGAGADPYGPKAVRASAGSVFRLPPALSDDPAGALSDLRDRGLRTLGAAAGRGLPYDRADLCGPLALVVGSESHGLPASLAGCIDGWVHVPLGGQAESLNVGAAAAVLCFEVQRRRRHTPTGPPAAG